MKKFLQKTALVALSLLYCVAVSMHSNAAYAAAVSFSTPATKAESYQTGVAAKTFQHTVQTENAISVCSHHNPVSLKNTYAAFCAANLATQQVQLHTCREYEYYYRHKLVRLQSTDIIFPFHYFW